DGKVGVTTYAASDKTIILEGFIPPYYGGSAFSFFAAAPGQHYRVLISHGGAGYEWRAPFRYTIKATYTKLNDSYEPNDNRAASRSITVGQPITAYSFAGFTTGHTVNGDWRVGSEPTSDWYKVDVAAGM